MTQEVGTLMMHYTTAKALWDAARNLTCTSLKSRLMVFKIELNKIQKQGMKMEDYLAKIKHLSDQLALAGAPVPQADLIMHTLSGLDSEYNPAIFTLNRQTGLSWEELHSELLAFESRLEQQHQMSSLSLHPTVNMAQKEDGDSRSSTNSWRGNRGFRGRRGSRGRRGGYNGNSGNFNTYGGNRPYCHLCERHGHTVLTCFHRFDRNFQPPSAQNHGAPSSFSPQAMYATPHTVTDPAWYFDSGATHHVTPHSAHLDHFTPGNMSLYTCTGDKTPVTGIGTAALHSSCANLLLKDVLVVPAATKNLLSVHRLAKDNPVHIQFTDSSCIVKDNLTHQPLVQGTNSQGMYKVTKIGPIGHACVAEVSKEQEEFNKWHYKLGHPSDRILHQVLSKCSLKFSNSKTVCQACQYGKSKLLPFSKSVSHVHTPLELVHTDLWGPSPTQSVHGFRYYILFIDDFSRYTWLYPLKHKEEAINAFHVFKAYVENKFSTKIKTLRCDNGGEYKPFVSVCQNAGIEIQYTCPYTSEQNGRAERKHRHVVEMGLTLLAQANFPLTYWCEAFQTSVYLINRLPTPILKNSSPLFELYKEEPNYGGLQVFGCACYPCLKPYNTHKFQFHSQRCIYLGPAPQHKGHRCLSSTGRIYTSRHVIFDSSVFPGKEGFVNRRNAQNTNECILPFVISPMQANNEENSSKSAPTAILGSNVQIDEMINEGGPTFPTRQVLIGSNGHFDSPREPISPHAQDPIEASPSRVDILNSPQSLSNKSIGPQEVTGPSSPIQVLRHSMTTRARDGIFKPKVPYIGSLEATIENPSQLNQDQLISREPNSVSEALSSSSLRKAMESEFQALMKNGTWILVPRSGSQKLVDSKWVFKIKYNSDGSILKHKARLVAKGFQQTPGVDFGETFSPVIKATTVRIILTLAVTYGWQVRQMDVNNAFLNGHLQEVVFMRQPEGFEDKTKPLHVCKLVKALYGLKQAPRAWFDRLRNTLLAWGFQSSKCDVSLFFLKTSTLTVFVLVYVDDILVTGNDPTYLSQFISKLNQMFSLKDLEALSYFLGIEVQRTSHGMYLNQEKYITNLLKKFNMSTCATVPTPMVTGRKFSASDCKPMENPYVYRQAIGSLQYLTTTRPDIAFSVNKLSQFLAQPTDIHFQGVKQIFRFLKGTKHIALLLRPVHNFRLVAFTDADWATDTDDRRSMGGMCTYLGDTLLSWSSRKQRVVSRSSAESEYRALADSAAEVRWIVSLLTELGVRLHQPSQIWCDNLSAKALASNPVQHVRSKHIEIDVHFVRDMILAGEIDVSYIPPSLQVANCFTKALTQTLFEKNRDKLSLCTVAPSSLKGRERAKG